MDAFLISWLAARLYLSLTGQPINLVNLLPWFVGGVLIDLDHVFRYSVKSKTFNLKKLARLIVDDYRTNNQHFYIFHTIEFALFFSLIILKTPARTQYLLAYLLHLVCDGARHRHKNKNFFWLKKWSLYLSFIRRRNARAPRG